MSKKLESEDCEIPAVETRDSIEHFGHGTAEDIHTGSHPAEDSR